MIQQNYQPKEFDERFLENNHDSEQNLSLEINLNVSCKKLKKT